jgi:WD40 repeat protein
VAYSPDGKTLAAGTSIPYSNAAAPGTVQIWDVATKKVRLEFPANRRGVTSLAFAGDGQRLATAGEADPVLRLWHVATGKEGGQLKGHKQGILSVAWSSNGHLLASGGWDGVIKFWDPDTGQERRSLQAYPQRVHRLVFSPNNTLLASTSIDAPVKVWDAETGELLASFHYAKHNFGPLLFTPDGRHLLAATRRRVYQGLGSSRPDPPLIAWRSPIGSQYLADVLRIPASRSPGRDTDGTGHGANAAVS